MSPPKIAVLVPCYNEEVAIPKVVADFRAALPEAMIYVYDNNSRDRTVEVARTAGAVVRRERQQGKGHVVRRMFADIEADLYVLVDGDDTYDARLRAGNGADADRRTSRHGHRHSHQRVEGELSARPSLRQCDVHRHGAVHLRRSDQRHAVGLSGVQPPVREVVSRAVVGVRDRDRVHGARARARHAGQ